MYFQEMLLDKKGNKIDLPYQIIDLMDKGTVIIKDNVASSRNADIGFYNLNTKKVIADIKYELKPDHIPESTGNYWLKDGENGWNYYKISAKFETVHKYGYDNLIRENDIYITEKERKHGFVSRDGQVLLPCEYKIIEKINFKDRFSVGTIVEKNKQYGIFLNPNSRKGNAEPRLAIEVEYDTIFRHKSDDLLELVKDGKHGLLRRSSLTSKPEWLLPCAYEGYLKPVNGVYILESNGKYGMVNKSGDIIVPAKYAKIEPRGSNYSGKSIHIVRSFEVSKKNNSGTMVSALFTDQGQVTEFIYKEIIETDNQRYLMLRSEDGGKQVLFDVVEKQVIGDIKGIIPVHQDADSKLWIEGPEKIQYLAPDSLISVNKAFDLVVRKIDYGGLYWLVKHEGKYGIYNINDNVYDLDPVYDTLYKDYYQFNKFIGSKNGKIGIIDDENYEVLIPFEYDSLAEFCSGTLDLYINGLITVFEVKNFKMIQTGIDFISGEDDLYMVNMKGKKHLYNCNNQQIMAFEYEHMEFINGRFIKVEAKDKFGVMDLDRGELLIPAVYDRIEPVYDDVYYFVVGNKHPWAFMDTKSIVGLMNHKGQLVVPIEYDDYHFSDYRGLFFQKAGAEYRFEEGQLIPKE